MLPSHVLQQTTTALADVFAAGTCALPCLHLQRPTRTFALTLLAIPTFLAPLLVPLPFTEWRFVVSLASIMIGLKLYDLHHAVETGPPPPLLQFLAYLPNGCNLVFRRVTARKLPPPQTDALRLLWLAPTTTLLVLAVLLVWHIDWRPWPWIIEHCAKTVAIAAFIQFASNLLASVARLMRIPTLDFSGQIFAAATPAEFWRRWNQPAGQFLREYLFTPLGGSHRPWTSVMTTFAINGLLHEYVFGIAAGRLLGYALPFFLIHGAATAATMRLRPKGRARALGIPSTLLFNLTTSPLIFACIQPILGFYATRQ